MAEVSLQGVGKVFPGPVEAVADVSLSVADGEFVVLVGPSGCGKSTTLRMVAGLEDATSGTITIGGRVVNDVQPKDRDIAMVFQNYALYPHMSVYNNMAFALKMRRVARQEIDRRVRDAAKALGIEDLLSRRPRQLSGGQRQRVAVGRAIVREPKAFLFDEPLSNLDAKLRVGTRAELKALHQRLRTTTLYVTHDQEEAMTLGDRIVVMSRGRVQQAGAPLDVYGRPANRFVAGFIGTPAMNFIDGTIEREWPSFRDRGGGRIPLPRSVGERIATSREAVLGVRPQALQEAASGIELTVEIVEPLGDVMDVTGSGAATRLVARLPARAGLRAGDRIHLAPDPERIHLFEPGEFGRNLLHT